MKANNKFFMRSDNAQVGIGTLIIFIAMVLVAAVAAAVLIQTSGVLQQKAQQTGKESTKEVSSNVAIDTIEGWRGGTQASESAHDVFSNELYRLDIRASLKVGSEPVDMNQAVITISDGTTTNDLRYVEGELITAKAYTGATANGTNTTSTAVTGKVNTTYRLLVTGINPTSALNKIKKVFPDVNTDAQFALNTTAGSAADPFLWDKPDDGGSVIAIAAGIFDPISYVEATATNAGGAINVSSYLVRGDIFYVIEEIRDEDKSFTKSNPVMNKGDLVKLTILSAPSGVVGSSSLQAANTTEDAQYLRNDPLIGEADLTITPRSTISINIVPEGGANTQVDFVAPSSFGVKANVGLYP